MKQQSKLLLGLLSSQATHPFSFEHLQGYISLFLQRNEEYCIWRHLAGFIVLDPSDEPHSFGLLQLFEGLVTFPHTEYKKRYRKGDVALNAFLIGCWFSEHHQASALEQEE
ncbi:hypothetical protein QOT17_012863 [Balamuthia mandrillaris]